MSGFPDGTADWANRLLRGVFECGIQAFHSGTAEDKLGFAVDTKLYETQHQPVQFRVRYGDLPTETHQRGAINETIVRTSGRQANIRANELSLVTELQDHSNTLC